MRATILLLCLVPACLPTKSEVVFCNIDKDCNVVASGLRCDQVKHVCTCEGTSFPGCEAYRDGGTSADAPGSPTGDGPADVFVATPDVLPPSDAVSEPQLAPPVDAPMDLPGPDTRVPDAQGTCSVPGDCKEYPEKAFCVNNLCVSCKEAGPTACSGPASVCDGVSGRCVGCLDSSQCASGVAPICDTTKNACTICIADGQCGSKNAANPACRADGQCVQCTSANATKCTGTNKFCDAKNTCVQCLTSTDCTDAAAPICGTDGKCKPCASETDCLGLKDDARYACSASGACVQCTLANPAKCTGGTPACEPKTNTCVVCTSKTNCSGIAPICGSDDTCKPCAGETDCAGLGENLRYACAASGACVQCTAANSAKCTGRTPACKTATNTCVACTSPANCSGTAPMCGSDDKCKACGSDLECAGLGEDLRYACAGTGACVQCTATNTTKCTGGTVCNTTINNTNMNKCVVCTDNTTCSGSTPICATATNTCRGCGTAGECAAKNTALPACSGTGACVQCTTNATCSGTTPICETSTNTCRPCTADSECTGIGPGVCMNHQNGRCASTSESIIVNSGGTLPASVAAGKRLLVVRGSVSGSINWTLSGPQMTMVGQNGGTLTGAGSTATLHLGGGDLYIRGLSITGGSPGVWANGGAILRLDHVDVSNNTAGGILLDGAGFDIRNTTVNNNGANIADAAFGGIRIQNAPTSSAVPKSLALSTISANQAVGVSCATGTASLLTAIPTSVLVSNNTTGDVGGACGFTSCGSGSAGCGAQP